MEKERLSRLCRSIYHCGWNRLINLAGQRYGRLTVLERTGTRLGHTVWKCRCDCGKACEATSNQLRRNRVKSCGCLRLEFLAIGRRAANVRVPVAVPITYPIPPNTDPVMARRYQWRWERVEREIESELRLGRQHKEPKCKFTDNNGKKIVPIDLIELAERKGRQAIPSRILPITEVPSSNRLGSSVADRVRIVTTEEFERL